MQHDIAVVVKLGRKTFSQWNPPLKTDTLEIDAYGSLWGESQVLFLGAHFDSYSVRGDQNWGLIVQTQLGPSAPILANLKIATEKLPGGSVAGNFGEVLTILALEWKKNGILEVCHLRAQAPNVSSPDLLVESAPFLPDYLARFPGAPPLPPLLPVECKNSDPTTALRQLASYWRRIGSGVSAYGHGVVSTIDYKRPAKLTLRLFVPKDPAGLDAFLSTRNPQQMSELTQDDFKGYLYGIPADQVP